MYYVVCATQGYKYRKIRCHKLELDPNSNHAKDYQYTFTWISQYIL